MILILLKFRARIEARVFTPLTAANLTRSATFHTDQVENLFAA